MLAQYLYSCILDRLEHPRPYQFYTHEKFQKTLNDVWSRVDTLFVARQRLELVGVMRRTVVNVTRAVCQVSQEILVVTRKHVSWSNFKSPH